MIRRHPLVCSRSAFLRRPLFFAPSGRPILFGYSVDGRKIAVVYEQIDDRTIYPITAYEVD